MGGLGLWNNCFYSFNGELLMFNKYSHRIRKILLSILLSFCFVNSQHTVDSIGVSNDSLKSEYDLLNKMISDLEILIQTNQSLENEKIHQLEKSITNQSTNFDDKVKNHLCS